MPIPLLTGDQPPSGARTSAASRTAPSRSRAVLAPEAWLVASITAVAALLRFSTITSQSFWVDEATTVHEVSLSFGAMLHMISVNETTPPLYFALAWIWTRLFGSGELEIRSFSAVCGIALVPVIYLCTRELVTRRAGVVAAALAAVSPFMIWYSQEARSYMLFALLSALSFLFAARTHRTRANRDLALWSACSVLAVLTHFFAAFLVAPEAVWLLWSQRNLACVTACGAVAAAQLAVLPLAIGDTGHPLGWITAFPLDTRIQQIPVQFGLSNLSQSAVVTYGLDGAAVLAVIVAGLLWLGGETPERRGAAIAAAFAACVLLVPIALAQIGHDYVFARNFIAAWAPLAVVLGAACTVPRAKVAGAALAVVLLAAFVWAGIRIDANPAYQRPDWRGAAGALRSSERTRGIVAYAGNAAEEPLAVYLPRVPFSYSGMPASEAPVTISELDVVGNAWQTVRAALPVGIRLISNAIIDNLQVARFALAAPWRATPPEIAARARLLLGPASATGTAVLIQPGTNQRSAR